MHDGSYDPVYDPISPVISVSPDFLAKEKMESDLGKLFVGGISWDTDEDRLKEYFSKFGEVVEAVIMRDRNTNRARGFGFVVFVDPVVAGRVVKEKHVIDGRTVEAKKAVPRDDKSTPSRTSSIQGSPSPGGRSRKIFVGGLPSTVNESDFKTYFEQFGNITDVVVMYDHNTQRPRGFGFITFDSEDAVDRALHKTFHELNGKMVEVKRAVPRELSPVTGRSPLIGYNFGFNRVNNFLSNYPQGFNLGSLGGGGYGVRVDDRFNTIASGRSGFSQFGSPAYGIGLNLEPAPSPSFGGGSNFSTNVGYGRVLSPYFGGSPNRYSTPIGYNTSSSRGESFLGSSNRNLWGNVGGVNSSLNSANSGSYLGSGNGVGFGVFGLNGPNWGSSVSAPIGGTGSSFGNGNVFRGGDNNSYGLGSGGIGRSNSTGVAATSSFASSSDSYEGTYGDLYRSRSVYGDPTWQSASSDVAGSGSFGYRLGNSSDMPPNDSEGYVGGYSIANRQSNTGIAA